MMITTQQLEQRGREYKYGFETDIEQEAFPKGLNEAIIRAISARKGEPDFLLDFRLRAFAWWQQQQPPTWGAVEYPPIDFQDIRYFSAPKSMGKKPGKLESADPILLRTFARLGIPLEEGAGLSGVAVDAVFDSVSVGTTHQKKLAEQGIIFCSFSEAARKHPELIQQYLGTVVPPTDNFYAALNSAVFSDGSFVYIPKGVKCPMDLSTYFRINARETGQFERTLIIAEEGAEVSYVEGCTAPARQEHQLHAAIVELIALDDAHIRYSTVQNWYGGDTAGRGGIFNFVVKRGRCQGRRSKISWTQVEAGAAITWKYPSVVLLGDDSVGEFYSVALTNNHMQADTGTKMIHVGKNTRSTIISKGIACDQSKNSYRGLVRVAPGADHARNFSQCDSMLVGDRAIANTFPYLEVQNHTATVEHEATTSRISADQLFYLQSRGLDMEAAVSLLVNGFCKEVFKMLPLEYSVEAMNMLEIKLEHSIG